MAILFAGGELEDFEIVQDSGGAGTTPNNHDYIYSRVGIDLHGTARIGCTIIPSSEIWISTQVEKTDPANDSGNIFIEVESSTGPVMRAVSTGTDFAVDFQRWDGSAWVTVQTVNPAYAADVLERHVFRVFIGASGALEWYRAGNLQASYYGDTSALGSPTNVILGSLDTFSNDLTAFSEVIIASHDVSSARLKTMDLTAAGDLTAWTGAYTDIEAYDSLDTTFISSGTAGQASTFQVANLTADTLDVVAVVLSGRVRKSSTGPTGINGVVRLGTTNYTQSLGTLSTAFEPRQVIWETDPSTTAKWLRADVDALQVGVESVA